MQRFYRWKHLNKETTFKCEFNLQYVFSKHFTADSVYEDDEHPCNIKAEYQVSDDCNDYWMCRKHLHSLFPTVAKEVIDKEGLKNKNYIRKILRSNL